MRILYFIEGEYIPIRSRYIKSEVVGMDNIMKHWYEITEEGYEATMKIRQLESEDKKRKEESND